MSAVAYWVAWAVAVGLLGWGIARTIRDVRGRLDDVDVIPRPDDWTPGP